MPATPSDSDVRPPGEGALTEWLLRGFAVTIYVVAVTRLVGAFVLDPTRHTLLFLLITEGYSLLMVLLARRARRRDMSPLAIAATGYAAFYYVLLGPGGTVQLVPEMVGVGIQVTGMLGQFASKVALGRSFGLLPAHRAMVIRGPYRLVRHPMYLGYFVSHVGFALVNFSWLNLTVFAVLLQVQLYRIALEEAVLSHSPEYREYQQQVRWRLFPFLY